MLVPKRFARGRALTISEPPAARQYLSRKVAVGCRRPNP